MIPTDCDWLYGSLPAVLALPLWVRACPAMGLARELSLCSTRKCTTDFDDYIGEAYRLWLVRHTGGQFYWPPPVLDPFIIQQSLGAPVCQTCMRATSESGASPAIAQEQQGAWAEQSGMAHLASPPWQLPGRNVQGRWGCGWKFAAWSEHDPLTYKPAVVSRKKIWGNVLL